jgi:hypothetical protein
MFRVEGSNGNDCHRLLPELHCRWLLLRDLKGKHGTELEQWRLAAFGCGFERLTESASPMSHQRR